MRDARLGPVKKRRDIIRWQGLCAAGKEAGAAITLKGYERFQLGEGIEKEESDFAAEVAAAAGA